MSFKSILGVLIPGFLLQIPSLQAQIKDPVQWTLTSESEKAAPGSHVTLRLTAQIPDEWHIYSLTTPDGGPIRTTLTVVDNPAISGSRLYQPKPQKKFDEAFNLEVETYEKETTFWLDAELAKDAMPGPAEIAVKVRYQTCRNTECLPPKSKTPKFTLTIDPSAPATKAFTIPSGYSEPGAPDSGAAPSVGGVAQGSQGLGALVPTAFLLGLAAIFTPCVFPMIPITVSFFLNQRGGLAQAAVFSLGIIVFFCLLGLGVTAAVGPFGVNQLGSNPWVNGFIAVVIAIFAMSLLGAFEITLPSSLLTKLDSASRRGGYLGTLLMGLTFSLTSFACIGPFMGSLLVASVQSKGSAEPVLGMMSFATGLASPFFLLAAFPSYLKKMPKSGGWLSRVKVVMGFVLLALVFKYASNIDQVLQLNWLTRERFLAAWFVFFGMAGLYLLGLLRMEGIEPGENVSIPRLLTGSVILIFAFSLLPGMFCAPLGELDAYVPASTGCAARAGGTAAAEGPQWRKNQYREALATAKQDNKKVLIVFTGYACTNCHWMKANMFPRPEIASAVKDMLLVELYTDGNDPTAEEYAKLEETKFATNSQPYYAILDADEKVLSSFSGSTRSSEEFLKFLTAGNS